MTDIPHGSAATVLRAHPATIVGNLWRVRFFVIIPILRGFITAPVQGLAGWLAGAWFDICILLLMLSVATLRWRRMRLWWNAGALCLASGAFFGGLRLLPWNKVVTVTVTRLFYLRPVRAVRLDADTVGGNARRADLSIILSPADAGLVVDIWENNLNPGAGLPCERQNSTEKRGADFPCRDTIYRTRRQRLLPHDLWRGRRQKVTAAECGDTAPPPSPPSDCPDAYKPRLRAVLAMSLLNSNSLGGIVFAATLVSQSGKLIGVEFSRPLLTHVEETARRTAVGVPPAAMVLAWALLAGWLVSFLLFFARYWGMNVRRCGRLLRVAGGAGSRREYVVRYGDISYIDLRRSAASLPLGLYTLVLAAAGCGKRRDDISCVIPTEKKRVFLQWRRTLFPELTPAGRTVIAAGYPPFLALPLAMCLSVAAFTGLAALLLEGWAVFSFFVGGMALLPCLLLLIVRFADARGGGLARRGEYFTLRYSRGFYLHTVVVERAKIVSVITAQSPLQRRKGLCTLTVRTHGERAPRHRCRALPVDAVEKLFA